MTNDKQTESCTLSWDGKNVHGDADSIKAVQVALHEAGTVPELKERIRQLQDQYDNLLKAEHRLSESYLVIREMVGAMNPPSLSPEPFYAYVEQRVGDYVHGIPDAMRIRVLDDLKERLSLSSMDEANVGAVEILHELNEAYRKAPE